LVGDFGLYGLLPQLFPQGKRGLYLIAESLALRGIAAQRKHESGGEVAVVASDDGAVVVEQGCQQCVGNGDLPMVEQQYADVFDGNGAFGFLLERCRHRVVLFYLGKP